MSIRKLGVAVTLLLAMSFAATAAPIIDVALVLMSDVSVPRPGLAAGGGREPDCRGGLAPSSIQVSR